MQAAHSKVQLPMPGIRALRSLGAPHLEPVRDRQNAMIVAPRRRVSPKIPPVELAGPAVCFAAVPEDLSRFVAR